MSGNSNCSVYIGNLDERVTERVLYDILIQAGRVVDLHIPKDKETEKPKGYAFAEYETEEIADYAVRLFSGLVTLYNRTLKFAMSGRDKTTLNGSTAVTPTSNSSQRSRPYAVPINNSENFQHPARLSTSDRYSDYAVNHSQEMRISTQKSCKVPLFSYNEVNMNGRRTNLASENYPKESAERYVWLEKILFYPFVNIC
ncbi:protein HSH49 isoform X1 [Vigna radiata var. radiata]|uniref:Protein HSH49 isoform X1 n=1 Tax=Vigna radiata var. radiata TaxID=3916 RepID=A0A3Q0FBL3_VIGRR|nr:protein HSH49 isoform X1 [Vigna radiata var. radiata]